MGLGAEIVMAVIGLWAVCLRPLVLRFAGEMMEVIGYAMHRIMRGRPSLVLSTYLPHSASFLHGFYY
ncbi:Protein anachronism like [Actinidia chinensis var. chinensis]|uniref:Protein anachronism like n=1 Tax=Actinidia chinensis var. chinensis TaxID=1590841 RepID=A0A2R6PRI9_ACTCC|nr:Protein anachronism like [Actinidia chinensis var. chinensis]